MNIKNFRNTSLGNFLDHCHSSYHEDGSYSNRDCDSFYEMMTKAIEGRCIIYKDVDDFLNEDGFYRIYRTDNGWTDKRKSAKCFLKEEAQLITEGKVNYHIEFI